MDARGILISLLFGSNLLVIYNQLGPTGGGEAFDLMTTTKQSRRMAESGEPSLVVIGF